MFALMNKVCYNRYTNSKWGKKMHQHLIFGIFMYIYQKKKTTAKEIAEVFEISQRSVYRYVDALSCVNIPIYTQNGKNGGIFISENFSMSSLYFSKQEVEILKDSLVKEKKKSNSEIIDGLLKKL